MLVYIILIASITFLQRMLYSRKNVEINFDSYFHLFLINYLKKQPSKSLKLVKNTLVKDSTLMYPYFMHKVLSYFPNNYSKFIHSYFNTISDLLFNVAIFLISFKLSSSLEISLFISILYIFSPLLFSVQALGPRIQSFTPRLFGEIITNLSFISIYFYFLYSNVYFYLVAILLGSLLFITSKFSLQAFVAITSILFIYTLDYKILMILVFSFFMGLLISRGNSYFLLKQQYNHLKWYAINNFKRKMSVSSRNNFRELSHILKSLDIKKFHELIVNRNTFILVMFKLPILYFALLNINFDSSSNLFYPSLFVLSGVIVFFITSLRWFLFLGEAERYFNHVIFFVLFLAVADNFSIIHLYCFIAYGILFQMTDFIWLKRNQKKSKTKTLNQNIIEYLNQKEEKLKIVSIPYHLGGGWRYIFETKHQWFYPISWIDRSLIKRVDENCLIKYPLLDPRKLEEMHTEFDIDIFIISEAVFNDYSSDIKKPQNFVQNTSIEGAVIFEKNG